jgi:hypothetical protein
MDNLRMKGGSAVVIQRHGGGATELWRCCGGEMVVRSVCVRYDERKREGGCTAQVRNEGEKGRK